MKHYNIYKILMDTYYDFKDYGNPLKWYSYQGVIFALCTIVVFIVFYIVNRFWDSEADYIGGLIYQILIAEVSFLFTLLLLIFFNNIKTKKNLSILIKEGGLSVDTTYQDIKYPLVYNQLYNQKVLLGTSGKSSSDCPLLPSLN